jgi:dipeptidyl aminopeptidase/acylaminoacyl peptidase
MTLWLAGAAASQTRGGAVDRMYPAARMGGNYMHNFYLPPAPASTPWAPAWSPDGKTIAVSMYGSIWNVDPSNGLAKELTYGASYHSSPAWSPDGKWIVYTADDNHRRIQLEILNVASGAIVRLTDDDQIYLDPVFSPDGRRLAYVSTKPSGNFNVYVRSIAGGNWAGGEIAITTDNKYPRSRLYVGDWDSHIQPAWLKNGQDLLLVSNRGIPLGSGGIWRVPVEPNGMSKARKLVDEQSLYRGRPEVSVDGKRFIYSSTAGAADAFHHLYVLPVDGGYPYKMTFGDHEDFHPRWAPDGESIAFVSNEGGLPQLVVMETYGGRKKRVTIRDFQWKRPMGSLSVKVVDDATGKPVHARIQGVASDGKFYPPRDAYSRVSGPGDLFHTPGAFQTTLPPGKMTLTAVHGFEYLPQDVPVEIEAGKTREITVRLKRMADLSAKGWHNGSTHVHMNYGGNLRNTLENLVFMSKAEDQDIVNELVANKDNRILDWQYFVPGGGEHPVSRKDPSMKVIVGEEYRPPFYGHVFYIGLKEHLISPFLTGYEGTGVESLYPSNTDMFRKARQQGAVTGYVHAYSGDADPLQGNLGVAKGFPVDAALGTTDCIEWSTSTRATLAVWHHALNNDLKVAPTGGEDSISNLHITKLVGAVRTYAYLGANLTAESWIDALKKGRTFFSSGPLLDFSVNGKIAGEEIRLPASGGTLIIAASARSITPLTKVVIHHNGKVWRELPLSSDRRSASLNEKVTVDASGWYALYAEGEPTPYLDVPYPQASTNAVRVYAGDQKIRNRESAEYFIKWIDKLRTMAEEWPMWRSEKEKAHVFAQFQEARAIYESFLR